MRKSKTFELIRKASGTALLVGGLGFMGASSASAATPDVVFANHGDNLVAQVPQPPLASQAPPAHSLASGAAHVTGAHSEAVGHAQSAAAGAAHSALTC